MIYWIPYDYDNSFSIDWFNIDWSTIDPYDYPVIDQDGRPLTDYIFSQDRYRNLFSHFLQFYDEQLFNLDSIYQTLNYFSDYLYSAAEYDIYRTLDYDFSMSDFLNSYGSDYENAQVKQGILEFIASRKESLNQQIVFDGNNPIIYEASIEREVNILGEPVDVSACIWGNIQDATFSIVVIIMNGILCHYRMIPFGELKGLRIMIAGFLSLLLPNLVNMNGTFFHQMETMKNDFLFMAINLFRYWIQLPINLY